MGLYFIGVNCILFMIALAYAHSFAYVMTFLFFSLISLSALISHYNLKYIGLDPKTQKKQYAYEDEQAWNYLLLQTGEIKQDMPSP